MAQKGKIVVRKLKSVPEQTSLGTDIVASAVAKIPSNELARDVRSIFDMVHHNVYIRPKALRRHVRVAPLSPNICMGMGYDWKSETAVVHIDDTFLLRSMQHAQKIHHPLMARYFIDSAVGHAFIKDTRVIQEQRKFSDHEAMVCAWRWAGALALKQIGMGEGSKEAVIGAVRVEAKQIESDYQHDMMYYNHLANIHDVEAPMIRTVPAWTGIAYPATPEEQHSLC